MQKLADAGIESGRDANLRSVWTVNTDSKCTDRRKVKRFSAELNLDG